MVFRVTTPFFLLDWITGNCTHFQLDKCHPSCGCHHLLRVGLANIDNRSMNLDTKCDLAVQAQPDEAGLQAIRTGILRARNSLLAQHLGAPG